MPKNVIAILDIGKTNKKLLLFDEGYQLVFEKSAPNKETVDEDGDPCENLESLKFGVIDSIHAALTQKDFTVKAINFAAYGASLVYVNGQGKTVAPLYNYLKAYPETLKKKFYDTYGGETAFAFQTASPVLGSLNSGMQLYRIKHERPGLFGRIKYALHLPQYISSLVTGKAYSDITSIGCHTNLWDFQQNDYHPWVTEEGIREKLPPIAASDEVLSGGPYAVGIGLHDSSSAIIPYLVSFNSPFALISTGTWSITLNPFNHQPLTEDELSCDCLCYLQYNGKPVKASRLFMGYEHDKHLKRIASHFNKSAEYYQTISFHPEIAAKLKKENITDFKIDRAKELPFALRKLSDFRSSEEAYHQLVLELVARQHASTELVLKGGEVKHLFVDGGFSKNQVYMNLLASFFPRMKVSASSVPQATALGAALVIHKAWNPQSVPENLVTLIDYSHQ